MVNVVSVVQDVGWFCLSAVYGLYCLLGLRQNSLVVLFADSYGSK
jgi:hypothetical protein